MCKDCENGLDDAYAALVAADVIVEKALGVSEIAQIAKAEIRLRKYIEAKWNRRKTEAVNVATSMARKNSTPKAISDAIGKVMNKWSKDVLPTYNVEMARVYKLARIAGHKKATGQTKASLQFNVPKSETTKVVKAKAAAIPSFDLVDEQAVEMLESKNIFWVGNHYDANISDSVRDTAKTTMVEAGESTRTAGKLMNERITTILGTFFTPAGYVGTQAQYFEGLVANAMTVGRVYGQLRSFSQIGITKYTIVNPGGSRICEVCLQLQGTTFEVKQGLEQIQNEYAAKNPTDIKDVHPWPKASEVSGKSADDLASEGLSLPPYHFRCRCTVDVSTEVESYEQLVPIPFPVPPKAA